MKRAHINAAWKPFPWEFQVKPKLVDTGIEPPLPAQCLLILKKRGVAVAKVLCLPRIAGQSGICGQWIVHLTGVLENAHKSMKANREVREADRFDDCEDDGAFDLVSRRVSAMRFVGADVEVCQISRAGLERRC